MQEDAGDKADAPRALRPASTSGGQGTNGPRAIEGVLNDCVSKYALPLDCQFRPKLSTLLIGKSHCGGLAEIRRSDRSA